MDLLKFQSLIGIRGVASFIKLTEVSSDLFVSIPHRDYAKSMKLSIQFSTQELNMCELFKVLNNSDAYFL